MPTKYKIDINQDTLHRAKQKGCLNTDHRTGKAHFDSRGSKKRYIPSQGIMKKAI